METLTAEEFEVALQEGRRDFSHCKLENIKLSGTKEALRNIYGLDFSHSELYTCDFDYCNLQGLNFTRSQLVYCNFESSDFESTRFNSSFLHYCSFKETNLYDTSFSSSIIAYSDFTNAKTLGCNWGNANTLTMVGKKFINFQAYNREPAVYHEGFVRVACQNHSTRTWINDYISIGERSGWSKENIEIYGDFFRRCHELRQAERLMMKSKTYELSENDLEYIQERIKNMSDITFRDEMKNYLKDMPIKE